MYLWKNINNSFEYVPAVGGAGGTSITYRWTSRSSTDYSSAGRAGTNGSNRSTGGGGSGGLWARRNDYASGNRTSGSGAAGTSYSGGSGGGGIDTNYNGTLAAGNAAANGGPGGAAYSYRGNTSWAVRYAGGGAGNTGGVGKYTAKGAKAGGNNASYSGQNGTGGLLILYADDLYNIGTISSNGSNGGTGRVGGGSSGGGSINIFANNVSIYGTRTASGGGSVAYGGAGGTGTVTIKELKADLNYEDKAIELNKGINYQIDRNKLSYLNQNGVQTNYVTLGNLSYEVLDTSVATVDSNGKVTAIAEGSTKIKITDTTNNISTYLFLDVYNNKKVEVQEGQNFTIALKRNGTVWSYGLNNNGQLGIGNTENKTEPTQITGINNVKSIATGYSHSLALLENGQVYSWGLGTSGQLGNGTESNSTQPVKVDGISNIVKIDAYKNMSIALSSDGIAYVWGEGYSTLPMKIVFSDNTFQDNSRVGYDYSFPTYSIESGVGVNLKLGAIFNPVAGLRMGIAFHTPTYYSMDKSYVASMWSKYSDEQNEYYASTLVYDYTYEYNTPAKMLVGLSYTIGNYAIISLDYDRVWYQSMRSSDFDPSYRQYIKQVVKENFKGANNVRIGLEFRPASFLSLRGGYAMSDSPYKEELENGGYYFDSPIATRIDNFSFGVGFNLGGAKLDFAAIFSNTEYTDYDVYYYQADMSSDVYASPLVENNELKRGMYTMTFSLPF